MVWQLVRLLAPVCAVAMCARLAASDFSNRVSDTTMSSGIVYIVLAVDTEPAGADGPDRRLSLDLSNFSDDSIRGYVNQAMSESWRSKFTDSFGGNPKLTWYVLTSEHVCEAGSCVTIYDQMQNFRSKLHHWGDEIGWHYHHTDYVKCSRADREYEEWNQLTTFDGAKYPAGRDVDLCENVLNHLIADRMLFPVSFRSGWVWENDDFSRWLENVVPFDLSSSPPFRMQSSEAGECRSNESDWSLASHSWYPLHPDSLDYQKSGQMSRWLSRSLVKRISRPDLDSIVANVFAGRDQLVSIPLHSYSNMCNSFGNTLDLLCSNLAALGVRFKFATAADAFTGVLKLKQSPPPTIQLLLKSRQVDIKIPGKIFQSFPYIVALGQDSTLTRIIPHKKGRGHWTLEFANVVPVEIFVAASSPDGKSVVQSLKLTAHHQ